MTREPNTWFAPYAYEQAPGASFGQIAKIGERLVCHICGRDFMGLGSHVWWVHGLTADQYRAEWSIPATERLFARSVIEKVRHATITNGGSERIANVTTTHFQKGQNSKYQDLGTISARKKLTGNRRDDLSKGGLWSTCHVIIDRWRDGLEIDEQLKHLETIIKSKSQLMENE